MLHTTFSQFLYIGEFCVAAESLTAHCSLRPLSCMPVAHAPVLSVPRVRCSDVRVSCSIAGCISLDPGLCFRPQAHPQRAHRIRKSRFLKHHLRARPLPATAAPSRLYLSPLPTDLMSSHSPGRALHAAQIPAMLAKKLPPPLLIAALRLAAAGLWLRWTRRCRQAQAGELLCPTGAVPTHLPCTSLCFRQKQPVKATAAQLGWRSS